MAQTIYLLISVRPQRLTLAHTRLDLFPGPGVCMENHSIYASDAIVTGIILGLVTYTLSKVFRRKQDLDQMLRAQFAT